MHMYLLPTSAARASSSELIPYGAATLAKSRPLVLYLAYFYSFSDFQRSLPEWLSLD
jgi:hypothetical protein